MLDFAQITVCFLKNLGAYFVEFGATIDLSRLGTTCSCSECRGKETITAIYRQNKQLLPLQ
jgi:hypothetical protein